MPSNFLKPFEDAAVHENISGIIRQHSTNKSDVRQAVTQGLDLSFAKEILDLGCGFGFMAEEVAGRAAPGAHVTGVDACEGNRAPFLEKVLAAGPGAEFLNMTITRDLPWPDRKFDLIVCSYSLYFFYEAIPELARVLKPHGLVLVMTHSENAFRGLFDAAGISYEDSELAGLVRRFSAENGEARLSPFFAEISRIDYPNAILFEPEHFNELVAYVRFKLPLLMNVNSGGEIPESVMRSLHKYISHRGKVVVEKSDTCFRCRRPRSP